MAIVKWFEVGIRMKLIPVSAIALPVRPISSEIAEAAGFRLSISSGQPRIPCRNGGLWSNLNKHSREWVSLIRSANFGLGIFAAQPRPCSKSSTPNSLQDHHQTDFGRDGLQTVEVQSQREIGPGSHIQFEC